MATFRVLATADNHWDGDSPRWNEYIKLHDFMVEVARCERIDLVVDAGDIYERASTPTERKAAAKRKTRQAEICPDVTVRGNHDQYLDCKISSNLRTNHVLNVADKSSIIHVGGAAVAAFIIRSLALLAIAREG